MMIPLTQQEIDDFEPCMDSDCDDDVCAFARALSEARGTIEAVQMEANALFTELDGDFDSPDEVVDVVCAHLRSLSAILEGE